MTDDIKNEGDTSTRVKTEDGKYEFILPSDDYRVMIERHGEPWLTFTEGCRAVRALVHEMHDARQAKTEAVALRDEHIASLGALCDIAKALDIDTSLSIEEVRVAVLAKLASMTMGERRTPHPDAISAVWYPETEQYLVQGRLALAPEIPAEFHESLVHSMTTMWLLDPRALDHSVPGPQSIVGQVKRAHLLPRVPGEPDYAHLVVNVYKGSTLAVYFDKHPRSLPLRIKLTARYEVARAKEQMDEPPRVVMANCAAISFMNIV